MSLLQQDLRMGTIPHNDNRMVKGRFKARCGAAQGAGPSLDAVLHEVHGGADDVHESSRLNQDANAMIFHQLIKLVLLVCAPSHQSSHAWLWKSQRFHVHLSTSAS